VSWVDDKNLGAWEFKKSNWNFEKPDWRLKFEKTTADNRYDEGDRITDSGNPVWSMDKTGIPTGNKHDPCGYWVAGPLVNPFALITSKIYPIEVIEASESLGAILTDMRYSNQSYGFIEATESLNSSVTGGSLYQDFFLVTYSMLPEATESLGASVTGGSLELGFVLVTYSMLPEATESLGANLTGGELRKALITYSNYPPEATESLGASITGGSLDVG
jgi:hypothetical protein